MNNDLSGKCQDQDEDH